MSERVYLIRESGTDKYKIGRSRNPEGRLATLQTACSSGLEMVCSLQTKNAAFMERQLHSRYSSYRLRGEWFCLTRDQVAEIRAWRGLDFAKAMNVCGDCCQGCAEIKYAYAVQDFHKSFKMFYRCDECNRKWHCWWDKTYARSLGFQWSAFKRDAL